MSEALPATGYRPPAAGKSEIRVEVVEGRDGFVQLEKAWNDALSKGPHDIPMLRHEWLKAYIENFAPGATLRTFVARAGREIHAAMPLIEAIEKNADTCFLPMTTWALPVNDHSQRGGVLLGKRWQEGLESIWQTLRETAGWDRLRLRDLPEGAADWRLRELAEQTGFPCGLWISLRSPYLRLPAQASGLGPQTSGQKHKPPTAYEQIEARLDGKFRQNLRRRKRRLAELGEVSYEFAEDNDALADFFDIEASGWKGRDGTAIAQRPELVGFYTQVARDAAKRKALALGLLKLAGKPIAAHLSIVHGGRHHLIKIGYDESLHEYSPGQQLVSEAIRDSCERGLREFDFLGPCMEWKLDWESELRTHTWLTIFRPTPKGRLVHAARFTAWPVLKAMLRKES
ncbi:MAG: GNAT family N-acetyltransferase [Myxococcales bacterium]|nr:GNAT family N-acetyltransferase [Myxococcales bacterium]